MPPLHILNEEIDDEESFFDLVIKSDNNVINVDVHAKASNPIITPLGLSPKLKIFILGFKKQSKPLKIETKTKDSSVFIRENNSLRTQMVENSNFQASCDVVSSMKRVPKYLKLIKPFYTKKAKVTPSCSPTPVRLSEGSFNKLVKSRSTSVVGGMPPVPELRRRDDRLLEQHDGIQGAILHCKKSYSSSCHDQNRFSI